MTYLEELKEFSEYIDPEKKEEFLDCIQDVERELDWLEGELSVFQDELDEALNTIEELKKEG
jgi:hypothetical protein